MIPVYKQWGTAHGMLPLNSVEFYQKKHMCEDRRNKDDISIWVGTTGIHYMESLRAVSFGTHRPGGMDDTLLPQCCRAHCRPHGRHETDGRKATVGRELKKF